VITSVHPVQTLTVTFVVHIFTRTLQMSETGTLHSAVSAIEDAAGPPHPTYRPRVVSVVAIAAVATEFSAWLYTVASEGIDSLLSADIPDWCAAANSKGDANTSTTSPIGEAGRAVSAGRKTSCAALFLRFLVGR
jgi:hypothetical protein